MDTIKKSNSIIVPFSPPDVTDAEIQEVICALKSGWITTGPRTKQLEKEVASLSGTNTAVCLNSNTACAEMTLRLLGIGKGDEVIVPAYTYTATASVVCHVGAKLVMVDLVKDGFTMDLNKLENAINENTKVIIPVDIFGIPCDYDKINAIIERKKGLFKKSKNKILNALNKIVVMVDGAHSLGATYKGKPVASYVDFINYSFHAVKNLTTAEGGAVTWKSIDGVSDQDIYNQYMLYSLHGQTKDAFSKTELGAWEYDIVAPLYKCNMTDVHASIGLAQIRRYQKMLDRRKQIIQEYNEGLKNINIKPVNHYTEEYASSGHLYVTRIFNKNNEAISVIERNAFIKELASYGVSANVHYKPLPLLTAYKNLGFNIKDYQSAYNQYQNQVTLPLHTCLTDEQVEYVIKVVNKVYKQMF